MIEPILLDQNATCELLGGIHPATLWRGVKAGRYPKPIKVSPNINRWPRSEIVAVIERLAGARDAAVA